LFIDCQSLAVEPVPLPLHAAGMQVAVLDSGVPRTLATAGYNERRSECEQGLAVLSDRLGRRLDVLRDVTPAEFTAHQETLPAVLQARLRHVFSENARVSAARQALGEKDLARLGALMDASHASLRDDYEVSCPELDVLVDLCRQEPGVLGARLTGAGFGGCAIALARSDADLDRAVGRYRERTGRAGRIWRFGTSDGARRI
ncbi:MAG: galactokinase, partial [Cyanobacteria bacterium REEB65]|nr:galactokinase [Cyanobacteria bacterium REEB65]